MSNLFFDIVGKEEHPMYDAAIITESGIEYWKNPLCNFCNNGHSSTKFFITTAIGILENEGKLKRTDYVTSFFTKDELPEDYDKKWDKVTVEDTMRHRTGFDTIPYNVDNDDDIVHIKTDFLKYVFSLKIEKETGVYRRYSDEAFYLLGRIIDKASGMNAEEYLRTRIMNPLNFRQWSIAKCPEGHIIAGGGFYARADDVAKLGYTYAFDGVYGGKRIISKEWTEDAMQSDYACTKFRDTDVYVKTGACGQMVCFSKERKAAAAWHGYSTSGNDRNDRLLEAFVAFLDDRDKKGDK